MLVQVANGDRSACLIVSSAAARFMRISVGLLVWQLVGIRQATLPGKRSANVPLHARAFGRGPDVVTAPRVPLASTKALHIFCSSQTHYAPSLPRILCSILLQEWPPKLGPKRASRYVQWLKAAVMVNYVYLEGRRANGQQARLDDIEVLCSLQLRPQSALKLSSPCFSRNHVVTFIANAET